MNLKYCITAYLLIHFSFGLLYSQQQKTGFVIPSEEKLNSYMQKIKAYNGAANDIMANPLGLGSYVNMPSSYDLRDFGAENPIRDQSAINSCWAFSAAASYESNYFMLNQKQIDVSEQSIINCVKNTTKGGFPFIVFISMLADGYKLHDEKTVPYQAKYGLSCENTGQKYGLTTFNFINSTFLAPDPKPASVVAIKEALFTHGAISCGIAASVNFLTYKSGIMTDEKLQLEDVNHAINIIGWDDSKQAWLIRNSHGTLWGENGYGWVAYNANQIGTFATWVNAEMESTPEEAQIVPRPVDPKEGEITEAVKLGIFTKLKPKQDFLELTLIIDGKPAHWAVKDKNQARLHRVLVEPGKHKYSLLAKTIVKTSKGKQLVIGTTSGNLEISKDKDLILEWGKLIKGNIYKLGFKQKDNKA